MKRRNIIKKIDKITQAEYRLMGYSIIRNSGSVMFVIGHEPSSYKLHRHDGPAYVRYDNAHVSYYLYGEYVNQGDWLKYKHMTEAEYDR